MQYHQLECRLQGCRKNHSYGQNVVHNLQCHVLHSNILIFVHKSRRVQNRPSLYPILTVLCNRSLFCCFQSRPVCPRTGPHALLYYSVRKKDLENWDDATCTQKPKNVTEIHGLQNINGVHTNMEKKMWERHAFALI